MGNQTAPVIHQYYYEIATGTRIHCSASSELYANTITFLDQFVTLVAQCRHALNDLSLSLQQLVTLVAQCRHALNDLSLSLQQLVTLAAQCRCALNDLLLLQV